MAVKSGGWEMDGDCLVRKHLMLTIQPKVRLTIIYDPVTAKLLGQQREGLLPRCYSI